MNVGGHYAERMPSRGSASTVALVTGGSRGIGLAIAEQLTSRGTDVLVTGLNEQRLAAAAATLRDRPGRIDTIRADVRSRADVRRAMEHLMARFGGLDILVNNAGIGVFAAVEEMSDEQWDAVIGTNLTGVFYCCREALPHLRARGGGWIINISSLAGDNWFARGGAYCASKAALNAFSESLMQEVRYDNIRVSYVMPGSVETGFAGREPSGADWKLAPDDVARVVADLIAHDPRSLPSRVEIRPSRPRKA
jgi:NAD(P)-dependent dehydrogenase (short-subunit alcohol dehydrogenase family)